MPQSEWKHDKIMYMLGKFDHVCCNLHVRDCGQVGPVIPQSEWEHDKMMYMLVKFDHVRCMLKNVAE